MALPPDGGWYDCQMAALQQSSELDDEFNEIFYWNTEPPYINAPSTFDDHSTTVGSEIDVPPLTLAQSLTPSTRSEASPTPLHLEDSFLHHELGQSRLNDGETALALSPLDKSTVFQHMGGNPEIQVQESLSSRPKRLCLDDESFGLTPTSPSSQDGSPSQPIATPMRRGRSSPLPGEKRAKAKDMRKIKACSWCHTHKISVRILVSET